ncbi:sugar phosphate isomerase/epimerase [uncultured Cellulomonas sp.]|uniref:sugar phosphate isomerase/epimerase family protein n=1 Tax=uncultured Cellulomonas sp. TaxID=189682 RepID=UPI0026370B31|nr:sugar phosphate isomerase/epimerase [uncultured Cellulomonas sp.]
MRIAHHTITWGGVVGHPAGVTSVKDLYYLSNGSIVDAVREIGAAGYEGTEVFDGNLAAIADDPQPFLDALASAGVELVSVYSGANFVYADALPDEMARLRRACELARQFGASRLVVGGGARRAEGTPDEDYDRLGAALDRVCDLAAEHGLEASYHPHLSTIVESPAELERLMAVTRIGFCPDTAHLAAGGGDPATLIRRYPERLAHVHLKDIDLATGTFLPLGQGDLDLDDVVRAVVETGYDSWLVVELDSTDGAPRDAAAVSHAHLTELLSRLPA